MCRNIFLIDCRSFRMLILNGILNRKQKVNIIKIRFSTFLIELSQIYISQNICICFFFAMKIDGTNASCAPRSKSAKKSNSVTPKKHDNINSSKSKKRKVIRRSGTKGKSKKKDIQPPKNLKKNEKPQNNQKTSNRKIKRKYPIQPKPKSIEHLHFTRVYCIISLLELKN